MKNEPSVYALYVDVTKCATFGFDAYEQMDYVEDFLSRWFNGKPLPIDWTLPKHEIGAPDLPLHDFVYGAGAAPFVSDHAKQALEAIVAGQAEFRSIGDILGEEYFVLNVLNVLDCLDEEKSRIVYSADGRVLSLRQAVFDMRKIPIDTVIFKVPQDMGIIYVTQIFVECIRKHQLSGVGFEYPDQVGVSGPRNAFPDLPIRKCGNQ